MQVACRAEVALIGEVGTFANEHGVDRFLHQPIEIGIALTMSVCSHIDRHIIDIDCHVGAVVEIVATQEVLIGFALAAVLGNDQPRCCLEHFAGARHRSGIDLGSWHQDLTCQAWSDHRARADIGCARLRHHGGRYALRRGLRSRLRRLGGSLRWWRCDSEARKLLLAKRRGRPDEESGYQREEWT